MKNKVGFRKVLLGSVFALGLFVADDAKAQVATYYDNNVMVDLSVLDDRGYNTARPSIANPYSAEPLPLVGMPKSRLHGLPQGGGSSINRPMAVTTSAPAQPTAGNSRIVLRKPTAAAAPMPAPMAKAKPTTAPAAPVQMAAPAAPTTIPKVIKRTVTAKPKTQPKPTTVAKAAPKPKPVVMAQPKPAPKPVTMQAPAQPPKPKAAPVKKVETAKIKPVTPAAPKPMVKKETPKPKPAKAAAPAPVMAAAPPPPPPVTLEPKKISSKMKKDAEAKVTKTAALPSGPEGQVRITFKEGKSTMPAHFEPELKKLAEVLRKNPKQRVQLKAYAGGEELSTSKARRLSLARALAVRTYLVDEKVPSTQIDVRALGNKTTEEPFDRVDVLTAAQ